MGGQKTKRGRQDAEPQAMPTPASPRRAKPPRRTGHAGKMDHPTRSPALEYAPEIRLPCLLYCDCSHRIYICKYIETGKPKHGHPASLAKARRRAWGIAPATVFGAERALKKDPPKAAPLAGAKSPRGERHLAGRATFGLKIGTRLLFAASDLRPALRRGVRVGAESRRAIFPAAGNTSATTERKLRPCSKYERPFGQTRTRFATVVSRFA